VGYLMGFLNVVVQIVFGILIFLVLARFILQVVRADFYNPISQMFVKVTNPLLRPLRKVIPGVFGLDMAAIVLLLILQCVELLLTHTISQIGLHNPLAFTLEAVGTLIRHAGWLYLICIFITIITSWINPAAYQHPLVQIAVQITNPLLKPCRKILPPMGGIDFSPILALIIVYAIMFLIAAPLIDYPGHPPGFR
jgi:YggT family protein